MQADAGAGILVTEVAMIGTFGGTVIGCVGKPVGLSDMLQLIEMRRGDIADSAGSFTSIN